MDAKELAGLLEAQSGVIRRRQVLDLGGNDNDIERLLRRRQWARVHTGVYVDHTGPLSWLQRAWAAVLLHWPAALAGASALRAPAFRLGAPRRSSTWLSRVTVTPLIHPESVPPGPSTSARSR